MSHSSHSDKKFDFLESPATSPGSKVIGRSVSRSSNRSSLENKAHHKHNDYSCYIHIINRSASELQLIDAKPISGHFASGSPPKRIELGTDSAIELTDPKGPHGSKGWCAYRLHHPGRSNPVDFKLKFADPYWGGDENYLRATTQHPEWLSLKVLEYSTSGHPFVAYVEVNTTQKQLPRNHNVENKATTSVAEDLSYEGSVGDVVTDSSSESLPDYEGHFKAPSISKKEPIQSITPVDIEIEEPGFEHVGQGKSLVSVSYKEVENQEIPQHEIEPKLEDNSGCIPPAAKSEIELATNLGANSPKEPTTDNIQPTEEAGVEPVAQPASDTTTEPTAEDATGPDAGRSMVSSTESKMKPAGEPISASIPEPAPELAEESAKAEATETATESTEKPAEELKEGLTTDSDVKSVTKPITVQTRESEIPITESAPLSTTESAEEPQVEPTEKQPAEKVKTTILKSNEQATSGTAHTGEAKGLPEEAEAYKSNLGNDVENEYAKVKRGDLKPSENNPVVTKPNTVWPWNILNSYHGKVGAIALVFLTCYGLTAVKISRGLLSQSSK